MKHNCSPILDGTKTMQLKKIDYSAQSFIRFHSNGDIEIKFPDEELRTNKMDKPLFDNTTGESVIELSGHASDHQTNRSWAFVCYQKNGYSQLHYHNKQTEIYYIIFGKARVTVNDNVYLLSPGESIVIYPQQSHQVESVGEENLEMIVKCTPAWDAADQHFVGTTANITRGPK
jgi:mannose-6-phosphate isomerase-like protein (cupin superfamily)